MKEYRADCPGCGRICTLIVREEDGKFYLRGNTCNTGKFGALKKWDFLNEDNLVIEERAQSKNKRGMGLFKLFSR